MRRQKAKAKKTRHPSIKAMDDVEAAIKDKLGALLATKTEDALEERKRKLAELGKEPIDIIGAGFAKNVSALDDIYHSTSWQEMQVKIALHGVVLGIEEHAWLCNTLTYHYGFWPHTRPRFKAYCQLIAKDQECLNVVGTSKYVAFVKKEIEYLDAECKIEPMYDVPGHRDEMKAWQKLYNIVCKCKKRREAISKSKKKKQCRKCSTNYLRRSSMSLSSEQMGCLGELLSNAFKKKV